MKCSYIQFAPSLSGPQESASLLAPLWKEVASADIVVLPELANSGYNFHSRDQAIANSETLQESCFLDAVVSACREYDFHVVTGFNERAARGLYNSALLVGGNGVIGKYRKLHLFMNEKDFFLPGDMGLPVFSIPGLKLGMLVCFDWAFPETWRCLALQGAQLVAHPSNLVLPGLAQQGIPGYALTNRIHIITANRVGTESDLTFTGMSLAADTMGNVISQAPQTGIHTATLEIDPADAQQKQITPRNHLLKDRRPDVYSRYLG